MKRMEDGQRILEKQTVHHRLHFLNEFPIDKLTFSIHGDSVYITIFTIFGKYFVRFLFLDEQYVYCVNNQKYPEYHYIIYVI